MTTSPEDMAELRRLGIVRDHESVNLGTLPAIFQGIDPELLRRFKAFHLTNPWVYEEFAKLATKMKGTKRDRYSGWVIVNVIRWHHDLSTKSTDPFKINNDFIALYARLLIYHQPAFKGFFELRTMKASGRKFSGEERTRREAAACR